MRAVFHFFFFQAEDGIRDLTVTGVQTCALPIFNGLVPKPNTPFQWEAIWDEKELKRRLKWVSKNLSRIPIVEVRAMSARIAHEQALFSSADRRIARAVEATARLQGDLSAALRASQVDAAF